MNWEIWYRDGTSYSSCNGKPEDAPGNGVIAIVQESEKAGREVIHGKDWYVYDEKSFGGWQGLDLSGLIQYFILSGKKVVKLGEYTDNETYIQLIRKLKTGD